MQLIPETAARFNVRKITDPRDNIRGGMAYLRWLLSFFEGDVILVTAAYNAGEHAVERYRGVPPYAETRQYVARVTGATNSGSGWLRNADLQVLGDATYDGDRLEFPPNQRAAVSRLVAAGCLVMLDESAVIAEVTVQGRSMARSFDYFKDRQNKDG